MTRSFTQKNHKLAVTAECAPAIATATADDPVTIERSAKLLRFHDAEGRLLGTLTARSAVAKALDQGDSLLHCSIAWTYGASDGLPYGLASVRVITGDADDETAKWCAREVWGKPREPRPVRSYAIGLVGGGHFQDVICVCKRDDRIVFYRETDNPYDGCAIVAKTEEGRTVGYIPRANWLQSVVHKDGCGAIASIKDVQIGPPAFVQLEVTVSGDPLDKSRYQQIT